MSHCFCAALGELSVLSDDPRDETRLRRTPFGIEIQRWRLASIIVVPDGGEGGAASDSRDLVGAVPGELRAYEPTVENIVTDRFPTDASHP